MRPALALFLMLMSSTAYAAPMQAPAPKPQVPAPKPKQVSSEDKLFAQLKQVDRAEDAHPIEQKLMAMFRASGSPSVDLLITRVQTALAATDKATAKKLIDAYRAKLGFDPDYAGLEVYDMVFMLADAIKRNGYTGDGIRQGLGTIKDFKSIGGGIVQMGADRQSVVAVGIYQVKDATKPEWVELAQ